MSHPEPSHTFNDLMASTGRFVVYWSGFEQALGRSIVEARAFLGEEAAPVRGGLKERLDVWLQLVRRHSRSAEHDEAARALCDQALRLRDLRNLIIHGVIGGHAVPDNGESPHISCAVGGFETPTGEVRRVTLEELEHFIQAADACRRGCANIQAFNYRL